MEDANHLCSFQSHCYRLGHGFGRGQAHWLPDQASFPEELARSKYGDDGFFPLRRSDRNFDLALLEVKYGISRVTLCEDNVVLAIAEYRSPARHGGEKHLWVKSDFSCLLCHHRFLRIAVR